MAQQERAVRTYNAVLDSGAREFARHGVHGARLADIIAGSGYTKGAVYFHFDSKESIAHALVTEKLDLWPGVIAEVNQQGLRGLDAIKELARHVARVFRDDLRARAAVRVSQELGLAAGESNPYKRWASLLTLHLQQGIADGTVREDKDVHDLAEVLVQCFFGVQSVAQDTNTSDTVEQQLERMWDIVLLGVKPQ
ncbi:ScbR family autoregulator-binding transcription factor [Okibacterium endophyticum]